MLDDATCERARQTRDPRFDGRFFIGVRTTGIYCRPICPVRQPRAENVRFFPSAAAAAEAGFRPCLRCRPETAPGTPAWLGTSSTVTRALRLIHEGALDEGSVADLAERLGIGARHLTRLFTQHLGATPLSVAQNRRLHLAKRLLTDTHLPMATIAFASGYGSVRRFNEAIRATFDRPPSALRRKQPPAAEGLVLRLAYRPPFEYRELLSFFEMRALPGVEEVIGETYRRTIELDGRAGTIAIRPVAGENQIELTVRHAGVVSLGRIIARVRRMFDLDADPHLIQHHLERDVALAPRVKRRPGLRVPGAWDGFELAVRAVLGQSVSVKAARTLAERVALRYGAACTPSQGSLTRLFPGPGVLSKADLTEAGVSAQRSAAIRELSRAVQNGTIDLTTPRDPSELIASMTQLPGIGPWTAEYVALRALGEPDAFPAGDLGLLEAGTTLFAPGGPRLSAAALGRRVEALRPWRAYAAQHLWALYSEARASAETLRATSSVSRGRSSRSAFPARRREVPATARDRSESPHPL